MRGRVFACGVGTDDARSPRGEGKQTDPSPPMRAEPPVFSVALRFFTPLRPPPLRLWQCSHSRRSGTGVEHRPRKGAASGSDGCEDASGWQCPPAGGMENPPVPGPNGPGVPARVSAVGRLGTAAGFGRPGGARTAHWVGRAGLCPRAATPRRKPPGRRCTGPTGPGACHGWERGHCPPASRGRRVLRMPCAARVSAADRPTFQRAGFRPSRTWLPLSFAFDRRKPAPRAVRHEVQRLRPG